MVIRAGMGLLLLAVASLEAQTLPVEVQPIDPADLPSGATSFKLARHDYGSDEDILLTWHLTLRPDCERYDSVADPYGLRASPSACIGDQFISTQTQTPAGELRVYAIRNLPPVQHVEVLRHSWLGATVRVHLSSVFAHADDQVDLPRGDVVLFAVEPRSIRLVERVPSLEPPTVVEEDTSAVSPAWLGGPGRVIPNRLGVRFRRGLSNEERDSLVRQPGVEVLGWEGEAATLRILGDSNGCRLRQAMDFFETQAVVQNTFLTSAVCGASLCPAREGATCQF